MVQAEHGPDESGHGRGTTGVADLRLGAAEGHTAAVGRVDPGQSGDLGPVLDVGAAGVSLQIADVGGRDARGGQRRLGRGCEGRRVGLGHRAVDRCGMPDGDRVQARVHRRLGLTGAGDDDRARALADTAATAALAEGQPGLGDHIGPQQQVLRRAREVDRSDEDRLDAGVEQQQPCDLQGLGVPGAVGETVKDGPVKFHSEEIGSPSHCR